MLMNGLGLHFTVRLQENFKIVIEYLVKATQSYIFNTFLFLNESSKMLIGTLIAVVCLFDSIHSNAFLKLLIVFAKEDEQCYRLLPDTFNGILYKFSGNKA